MRVLLALDGSAGATQPVRLAESIAVRKEDAAAEVIVVAEERQADLVVLGSLGRTGLTRIPLGSVARNVLAGRGASVLIVRNTPGE